MRCTTYRRWEERNLSVKKFISYGILCRLAVKMIMEYWWYYELLGLNREATNFCAKFFNLLPDSYWHVFVGFVLIDLKWFFFPGENKIYWSITVCSRWLVISSWITRWPSPHTMFCLRFVLHLHSQILWRLELFAVHLNKLFVYFSES